MVSIIFLLPHVSSVIIYLLFTSQFIYITGVKKSLVLEPGTS